MNKSQLLGAVGCITAMAIIASLAWLVAQDNGECANSRRDVSGAVLADSEGEQDALINRAIIVRGKCAQDENK
ncbi:MAG: hypothetical protein ACK5HY_04515 [Parahaliea sp.]